MLCVYLYMSMIDGRYMGLVTDVTDVTDVTYVTYVTDVTDVTDETCQYWRQTSVYKLERVCWEQKVASVICGCQL